MNQAFQIPGVGPTFDGSNGGMQYSGMMPQQQQPAQPAAPTDFMQLIGQQPTPAQGGNNAGGNADANAVLALFGQMLSGGAQGGVPAASPTSPTAAISMTCYSEPVAAVCARASHWAWR